MKRNPQKLIILIFSLLFSLFVSCSHKEGDINKLTGKGILSNYMYSYTLSCLKNENKNYFIPDEMQNQLNKIIVKDGIFYTVFELLYPDGNNNLNTFTFYDLYNDDCGWVDSLLMELEEKRIASELLEMENHLADVVNPISEENEQAEAKDAENKIEEYIKNEVVTGNNNLGYMEYGNERFIPQVLGDSYILIHSNNDNTIRNFYDSYFRCYKKETWKISSSSEELISTVETKYNGDSYIPDEEITISKNCKNIKRFNTKGLLREEIKYALFESKDYIKSSLKLKYNNNDEIKESLLTEYTYKDDKYSKLLYTFNKKYLYNYHSNNDIPADFDYYENDVLKMRNQYISSDTYTSRIYFDEGYSVTTFYQNNVPIKEVFAVKDVVERVNTYE